MSLNSDCEYGNRKKGYQCIECGKLFAEYGAFRRHTSSAHSLSSRGYEKKLEEILKNDSRDSR